MCSQQFNTNKLSFINYDDHFYHHHHDYAITNNMSLVNNLQTDNHLFGNYDNVMIPLHEQAFYIVGSILSIVLTCLITIDLLELI